MAQPPRNLPEADRPWQCSICGEVWPVLSLARSCEAKHKRAGWYHTWRRPLPAA